MSECIMVACDLHDKTMLLKIARGREAAETMTVRNTPSGRQRLIADLRQRLQSIVGSRLIFAYEASGQGFGLHDELTDAGFECQVLAPTKIARSVRQAKDKTDEKDAALILQLLRGHVLAGNPLPTVWIPDPQTRDDREIVRARLDLAEKTTAVKAQVKGLLKRNRLERPEGLGAGWTRLYFAWLRGLLRDTAVGQGARNTLASLLRQLDFLEKEIERVEKRMLGLAEAPRYQAAVAELHRLKGVGVLTALVFLTEIGNMQRFANRRQISAYLGLVPSSQESGSRSDCKGHITRQGPSRVRRILCQATWARVRQEGPDRDAYQRIAQKNPKHKKVAVVASMRRLGIQMWHRVRDLPPPTGEAGAARRTPPLPQTPGGPRSGSSG